MDIVLYHLGKNDRERGLFLFSTDFFFFSIIFNPPLVESLGMESIDMKG